MLIYQGKNKCTKLLNLSIALPILNAALKKLKSFAYAKELIHAPITVAEFYESCKDYPIVFAKDASESWSALALIGYKEKENLFIDDKGIWEKNRYIPAFIRLSLLSLWHKKEAKS